MNNQLKPCPFCGGEDLKISCNSYGVMGFVRCETCKALTFFPYTSCFTEKQLVETWNTRAEMSAVEYLNEESRMARFYGIPASTDTMTAEEAVLMVRKFAAEHK